LRRCRFVVKRWRQCERVETERVERSRLRRVTMEQITLKHSRSVARVPTGRQPRRSRSRSGNCANARQVLSSNRRACRDLPEPRLRAVNLGATEAMCSSPAAIIVQPRRSSKVRASRLHNARTPASVRKLEPTRLRDWSGHCAICRRVQSSESRRVTCVKLRPESFDITTHER
jgi:hypothetical protein